MKKLWILALAAMGATAHSQVWSQPWNLMLPSWQSTVFSCPNPAPLGNVANDDFAFTAPTPINGFRWWGTVTMPAQRFRRYRIHIYADNGMCGPNLATAFYTACVVPTNVVFAGVDCMGRNVFQFSYALPGPFPILPAGRYWLEIAEDDASSVVVGAPDFAWSAHQPVNMCPALQRNAAGAIFQPLVDPCNGANDDLAFQIF